MTRGAALRGHGAAALAECRARPWHVGTAAVVAGLLAGPRGSLAVLIAVAAAPLLASRAGVRLALVGAVLAGALLAQARLETIDATRLTPRIGHAARERVVLLDAPRTRPFGARVATARLDGERVLLRTGRGARWPTERVGAVLARARRARAAARHRRLAAGPWRPRAAARRLARRHRRAARRAAGPRRRRPRPRAGGAAHRGAGRSGRALARHGSRRRRRAARANARRVPGLGALAPRGGERTERDAARRPRARRRGRARAGPALAARARPRAPSRSTSRSRAEGRRSSGRG